MAHSSAIVASRASNAHISPLPPYSNTMLNPVFAALCNVKRCKTMHIHAQDSSAVQEARTAARAAELELHTLRENHMNAVNTTEAARKGLANADELLMSMKGDVKRLEDALAQGRRDSERETAKAKAALELGNGELVVLRSQIGEGVWEWVGVISTVCPCVFCCLLHTGDIILCYRVSPSILILSRSYARAEYHVSKSALVFISSSG